MVGVGLFSTTSNHSVYYTVQKLKSLSDIFRYKNQVFRGVAFLGSKLTKVSISMFLRSLFVVVVFLSFLFFLSKKERDSDLVFTTPPYFVTFVLILILKTVKNGLKVSRPWSRCLKNCLRNEQKCRTFLRHLNEKVVFLT